MTLSKRAIVFAEACKDGDIIEGKPIQLELLARNAQVLIDEYEARIAELEAEVSDMERATEVQHCGHDEATDSLRRRIVELEAVSKKIFDDMWILLDAVAMEADDTLWYDGGTTAHERLCDIAAKYDAGVAADLERRLEESC